MLPTLSELRNELRGIANNIERDHPLCAGHLRRVGNDLAQHAREDAESIGEDANDSFAAGDGGGDD